MTDVACVSGEPVIVRDCVDMDIHIKDSERSIVTVRDCRDMNVTITSCEILNLQIEDTTVHLLFTVNGVKYILNKVTGKLELA